MIGRAPAFWWRDGTWQALGLAPLSLAYGAVARARMEKAPRVRVGAPVLCVGNFTVGGSGKTPVAIALAGAAEQAGLKPGFLSRGYGRSTRDARLVQPGDKASTVGDEPLLLAAHAPTAVAVDRLAAARLLLAQGCDFLLMDDGFQSARIAIDFALVVVDGATGLGNGRVFPAGPLRAPLHAQMPFTQALLMLHGGKQDRRGLDAAVRAAARGGKPVFEAKLRPANHRAVRGKRLLAFAGIGNPQKFFDSLEEAGGVVVERHAFGDHHAFSSAELTALAIEAEAANLVLATTAKDQARLAGTADRDFLEKLAVLEVEVRFDPPQTAERIIEATRDAWRKRQASRS